jgi:hypothetical protein
MFPSSASDSVSSTVIEENLGASASARYSGGSRASVSLKLVSAVSPTAKAPGCEQCWSGTEAKLVGAVADAVSPERLLWYSSMPNPCSLPDEDEASDVIDGVLSLLDHDHQACPCLCPCMCLCLRRSQCQSFNWIGHGILHRAVGW